MNLRQVAQQVQYLLQTAVWPGTATVVFSPESVVICAGESDILALDENLGLPMAVVVPGGGSSDPQGGDEPGYWVRDLNLILAVRNSNDRLGSAALVGATRESVSDSRGRGVLEIEERVLSALELLNVNEGVTIQSKSATGQTTRKDSSDQIYALQEYTFEVTCTSALFFPPARRFAASVQTSAVSLSWSLPSARYDRYRMVLRRATGSTPPTSITDGTGVTLASNLATSVVDTVSPNTYSYALFATYDDFARSTAGVAAPASDQRSSDAVTASGLVVS